MVGGVLLSPHYPRLDAVLDGQQIVVIKQCLTRVTMINI